MLEAMGDDMARVGDIALAAGLPVHELRTNETDLEALFFELTESPENRNRNLAGTAGSGAMPREHVRATTPVAPHEGETP